MRRIGVLAVAVLLAACAGAPPRPAGDPPDLLDDAAYAAPGERIDDDALFALSPEMQRYLATTLQPLARAHGGQRALVDAMFRRNELNLRYDAGFTRPAADSFAARRGNCLSLVLMTAAFAKALDLQIDYRSADLDSSWSRRGDLVVASGHVNITLGPRLTDRRNSVDPVRLTVDFLPPAELQGLRSHSIDERQLVAMYLNNRAAEALAAGRLNDAYAWARAAVQRQPGFAAAFNTLGAVHRRHGAPALATRAFRHALALAPADLSAMANLAEALAAQGQADEAAAWRLRLARLEAEEPFHFYRLGRAAMARGDAAAARDAFTREAQRGDESADLHWWLGQAHFQLGDVPAATRALQLAAQRSSGPDELARYEAKLAWLRGQVRVH